MTDTHRHSWRFVVDSAECVECSYSATIAVAKCDCGVTIGPSQMERKLNAVECLSKTSALAASVSARVRSDWVSVDDLIAYAKALEGDDAKDR